MQGSEDRRPLDPGQLQFIMKSIEDACNSIQISINPAAAEAALLSLGQSAQPYQACQFIIENSQVANARFQAAAAIRQAAIREWSLLAADDRRNLIRFCLCFVMQHANSPEGYVQAKISAVAAQLMKRGWLDFSATEKEMFLYEVKQAVLGVHGIDVQFTGINFLESLISEFSPSTSSAMGLPREFHEKCRMMLELEYLQTFYSWAQNAAQCVTHRIMESDHAVPEVKACTAALRLMLQILNWDFQYSSSDVSGGKASIDVFSAGGRHVLVSHRSSECILVQPGPSWHDVLLSSGHTGWLLNFYGTLRQKFLCDGYWLDCPLAVAARKLIVQFCSLSGTIFPADNKQMQEHNLLQLLSGIILWIEPPKAVSEAIKRGKSESEMLDGCRALLTIATVTTPYMFDQLLRPIRDSGTLSLLSALMCEVAKDLMLNDTEEETWSWVARDILLDAWTTLLVPRDSTGAGANSWLPPEGENAVAGLFALIVEAELKAATVSLSMDDPNSDYLQASISGMDERLSSYALIGRAVVNFTVPFLSKLFSERFAKLYEGRGVNDAIATLEELYSLLLITGHVLADEGEGETPLVPTAVQTYAVGSLEADKHPAIALFRSILSFSEQCLNPEIRASVFSPRLMEAVVWFLARWSRTYLMPLEENSDSKCISAHDHNQQFPLLPFRKAWLDFCGEHDQRKLVLDIIVRICMVTLTSYPGEKDLQELTCYDLLNTLVRQKNVCIYLVEQDSWLNLVNAFAYDKTLLSLNVSHQRSLAQSLVLSASGFKSPEESNQYVRDLMGHMIAYLVELSSKNDLKSVAQKPDVIFLVSCLFERLRGAASAAESCARKAIYDVGLSLMNPVLIFLGVYKHEFAVVYPLLKFVVDWVDGQIIYLEAQETINVVNFCMSLLQLYSSQNIGKVSVSLLSSLLKEEDTEKCKDVRALIELLSILCSKDLVDFSSDSNGQHGINIPQVVYFGLHVVMPLISLDILKYPKLCHDYFSLLSHMLEVYPEMVTLLNGDVFARVLGSIDFGLFHQNTDIVDLCLRALNSLASYHFKETSNGKAGLGLHGTGFKDQDGNWEEGMLSRFLRSLLQLLLFEDYSADLISSAADALLPLIFCEEGVYQGLGRELMEKQRNPALKERVANAFQSLITANQLAPTIDRVNYKRFRKNLNHFLVELRGFLRTI